jgi:hypothetical protein
MSLVRVRGKWRNETHPEKEKKSINSNRTNDIVEFQEKAICKKIMKKFWFYEGVSGGLFVSKI